MVRKGTFKDVDKERLQYALAWFQIHALQRINMLNYFLVTSGVIATAAVTSAKEGMTLICSAICGFGILCSISFGVLDSRNRQLIIFGEDLLRELELHALGLNRVRSFPSGILLRDKACFDDHPDWWQRVGMKHRTWIRILNIYIGLSFVAGLLVSISNPGLLKHPGPHVGKASRVEDGVTEKLSNLESKISKGLSELDSKIENVSKNLRSIQSSANESNSPGKAGPGYRKPGH